jgi:para-nitrobenzyl esterase
MNFEYRPQVRLGGTHLALAVALAFAITTMSGPALAQSSSATLKDPIKTNLGLVSGTSVGEHGKEVHVYRGIPYAAPPVGDLRWRAPLPGIPWQGVRKSTEYGPSPAQYFPSAAWNIQESQMSEDCLYLNVNTPARTAGDKLPVMVWFHPGGLDSGTANEDIFNNPALPQHGVVVVTVNARLGAFGLLTGAGLSTESASGASGNYEFLDLIASLQWVRENIAAFGGDPTRVTIFGEGGGAQKVLWLLASPLAEGLFQRAIVETGTNRNFVAGQTMKENNVIVDTEWEAYLVSQNFYKRMGSEDMKDLRTRKWQDVVGAMPAPPSGVEVVPAKDDRMHPTIDSWSLMDNTINIFDEALGSDVPILIGGDENELAVFQGYAFDWLPALTHRKHNLYVYRFMHVPANWKKAGMKAPHGMEVPYEFGDLSGKWMVPQGTKGDPGLDKDDQTVAEDTMAMWVSFAATGDPSVKGLINWPAFKAIPGQDKYVTIDVRPEVQSGFLKTFLPADASESLAGKSLTKEQFKD